MSLGHERSCPADFRAATLLPVIRTRRVQMARPRALGLSFAPKRSEQGSFAARGGRGTSTGGGHHTRRAVLRKGSVSAIGAGPSSGLSSGVGPRRYPKPRVHARGGCACAPQPRDAAEALRYPVTPIGMITCSSTSTFRDDAASYVLRVDGRVRAPLVLTLEDLRSRPAVSMPVMMDARALGARGLCLVRCRPPWHEEAIGCA